MHFFIFNRSLFNSPQESSQPPSKLSVSLAHHYSPLLSPCSFDNQLSLLLSTLEPTLTSFCKMSISPAATTQATGECVVCGKETVTRCSACAKNGTEWMFFCSTEHQKLVSPSRLLFSAQIRAESSTYIDLEGTQTSLRRQVQPVPLPSRFRRGG